MVSCLPAHENQVETKHVESTLVPRLDETHTHGALSSLNDDAWGYQNAPINEESNWEDKAAAGIAERYGVQFPDFNYVGKTKTKTLQATHEREYDVYVIPGHTVALIPYSDMYQSAGYGDGYIRWYDYDTDLAVGDEYFGYHVNPSLMWQIPPHFPLTSIPLRMRYRYSPWLEISPRDR